MKLFFLVISILLLAIPSSAANRYVRPDATGSNNGTDWTHAYTSFPTTLTRGDTYYLADGSYGSVTIDDATSGTTYIYVKKASTTDHGTETGWNNSFGDGVAAFTSITISTSYVDIDGSYGQWASDLPNYVPYGITVKMHPSSAGWTNIILIPSPGHSNIRLRHLDVAFTNTPFNASDWKDGWSCILGYGHNWTLDYVWTHNAGNTPLDNKDGSGMTVTNSVIEKCCLNSLSTGSSEHAENVTLQGSNVTFKNNIIRDWASTGGLMLWDGDTNSNWNITGNVFTQTGFMGNIGAANGMLTGLSASVNNNINIINNTFVNISQTSNIMTMGSNTNVIVKNNIFDTVTNNVYGGFDIGGTTDYNFYYNVNGTHNEAHKQTGTSSPLVAPGSGNFHLKYATQVGDLSVGTLYNTDPDGIVRGVDGTWDRGAFEFSSGSPPSGRTPNSPIIINVQ